MRIKNKEDAPPEIINANDHVASENSDDFPRVSNCDLSSSMMRLRCVPRPRCMARSCAQLHHAIAPRNCFFSREEERGTRVDHLEHRRQTDDGREAAGALEARFFGPLEQEIPERILDRGRRGVRLLPPPPPPRTSQRCVLHARISPTYPRRCASGRCMRHRQRSIWP